MNTVLKALAALAIAACIGLAGCADQKGPAEQALAGIEMTLETSGAEIKKYLPERFAEVEAKVQELRASMEAKDYGDVVSNSVAVVDDVKRAIASARIERAKMRASMEGEWAGLIESMPGLIASVDRKIAVQGSRPPAGMDKEDWKQLVDNYDAARDSWSKSASEMSSATFEESVLAARDAKAKIAAIMESLGLKAS